MLPDNQRQARGESEMRARATLSGSFRLFQPDGHEIVISSRRARALLAILCLADTQPIERNTIRKLLWPGRYPAQGNASLRQCLLNLGKLLAPLGPDVLVITRNSVALRRDAVAVDLQEVTASDRPILAELDLGEPFFAWVAARRLELARGSLPAEVSPFAPIDAMGQANRRGVAVLPFSAGPRQGHDDYFADGMVDELITALNGVPGLQVAGRTSSFHYRGSALAPGQIAAQLGVSHLVEGSVQRQGEQVRIHVHLLDGGSGFELWGSRFDGVLDDIFGLQEAVARGVAKALADNLGVAFPPPVVGNLTRSRQAYDLYLQGRALGSRIFGDGVLMSAIHLLEQAVAIDPLFAEAWVELAEAHHNVAVYTQCLDRNAAALRMAECAHKAIALSSGLGYPYALLGTYEWTRNNLVGGLDYAFEAYAREPTHPGVAMRVASFLLYCGRTSDAIPYVNAAIGRDPIDARKYALLWSVHFGRGELADALKAGQRIVDLGWPSMYLAVTSAALGRHDVAVEQYQQTKRLVNTIILPPVGSGTMTGEAMDAYWLIAAKGVCGAEEADRQAYFQVLEMMYATLHDKADLAITGPAIFTGNAELVFKAFGHHITPANMLALVSLWADVEPMRQIWQHEEFLPFAQRIGMAAAWDKYGWPDLLPRPTNRLSGAD